VASFKPFREKSSIGRILLPCAQLNLGAMQTALQSTEAANTGTDIRPRPASSLHFSDKTELCLSGLQARISAAFASAAPVHAERRGGHGQRGAALPFRSSSSEEEAGFTLATPMWVFARSPASGAPFHT
jgi:hypothetical protein